MRPGACPARSCSPSHTCVAAHTPCAALARVEEFYDSIGGLAGYQLQCLQLLAAAQAEGGSSDDGSAAALPTASSDAGSSVDASLCSSTDDVWPAGMLGGSHSGSSSSSTEFLVPVGLDLASPEQAAAAAAAVAAGIRAVPHMAEIYPLGGAGDRLGLRCEATGEALPTAVLQYCGRPLLESLLRDLQVGGWTGCRGAAGTGRGRGGPGLLPVMRRTHSPLATPLAPPARRASTCTGS